MQQTIRAASYPPRMAPMNTRRQKYPAHIDDAIYAAAGEGLDKIAIFRALKAGELDGVDGPCEMSERTFWAHWSKLLKERGDPTNHVEPGQEGEFRGAIERELLEITKQEINGIRRKQGSRQGLSAADLAKLERCQRIVQHGNAAAAQRARADRLSTSKNPSHRAAAEANGKKRDPMADVRATLAAREQAPEPVP